MAYRPILFSGPMVRAILDGRKFQTRRLLKPQPPNGWKLVGLYAPGLTAVFDSDDPPGPPDWSVRIPYIPGDRLWVREAWRTSPTYDDVKPSDMGGDESICFEADGAWESWGWGDIGCVSGGRFRQGIHMPRWASRLTLTVTDVRVQRLQEISNEDAKAEGVFWDDWPGYQDCDCDDDDCVWCSHYPYLYTPAFRHLWDSLHAKRAPWESNPWVVAYTFTAERGNINTAGKGDE